MHSQNYGMKMSRISIIIAALSLLVAAMLGAIAGALAKSGSDQAAEPPPLVTTEAMVVHVETKSWTLEQRESFAADIRLFVLAKGGGPAVFTHNKIGGEPGPELIWWMPGANGAADVVGYAKYSPEKQAWVVCQTQVDPLPN